MTTLFEFLAKNGGLLTFVFLEAICIYLLISFDAEKNKTFISSANALSGWINNIHTSAYDYLNLKSRNQALALENKRLLEEMAELRRQMNDLELRSRLPEFSGGNATIDTVSPPRFIVARVIGNSINDPNKTNMFTLNRGSAHGVRPHCGVIDGQGIVGIVRGVSSRYSVAISLLNRQTVVSAAVRGKGYFGALKWPGESPEYMTLEDVPTYANIAAGDTVETSGYGHLFPKSVPIGTIESFSEASDGNFFSIKVKLINQLNKLEYVYVYLNSERDSIRQLENIGR
jgi:rod shape-determining protein MreC